MRTYVIFFNFHCCSSSTTNFHVPPLQSTQNINSITQNPSHPLSPGQSTDNRPLPFPTRHSIQSRRLMRSAWVVPAPHLLHVLITVSTTAILFIMFMCCISELVWTTRADGWGPREPTVGDRANRWLGTAWANGWGSLLATRLLILGISATWKYRRFYPDTCHNERSVRKLVN